MADFERHSIKIEDLGEDFKINTNMKIAYNQSIS